MDIDQLVSQISQVLLPALPYLALAERQMVSTIGSKVGESVWNLARQIWEKMMPYLRKDKSTLETLQEIAREVERQPPNEEVRAAFRFVLRGILRREPGLTHALEKVIRENLPATFNTSIVGKGIAVFDNMGEVIIKDVHIGDQHIGKTVEVKEVKLSLKLHDGSYPTVKWIQRRGFLESLNDQEPEIVYEEWSPKGYSYAKMKAKLVEEINKWVSAGWEIIEKDIDNLWVYDEQRINTVKGAFLKEFFGIQQGERKYKRVYYGAVFHVRKVVMGDS